MVVVYLQGGLGNQMFQYAFGKQLSQLTGQNLVFDLSHFTNPLYASETPRTFQLDQWNADAIAISEAQREAVQKALQPAITERLIRKLGLNRTFILLNDQSVIDFDRLNNYQIILLRGYFQNDQYFQKISDAIRADFQPREIKAAPFDESVNTVSLHVRRGDYITNANAAQHHGTCGMDYYEKAIAHFEERLDNPQFILFSDDINWCKEAFSHLKNKVFVEPNPTALECDDLWWMSRCKHNIIANSSYSWWGAWLNANAFKTVIAPARWLSGQTTERNDMVPKSWIQL